MADEDHLDRGVSVSVELTDKGVKAQAQSRLLSALDRLGGNAIEWLNVRIEPGNSERRSEIDARKRIATAAVDTYSKVVANDAALAKQIVGRMLAKEVREQANLDAIGALAIEDLRSNPPTDEQAANGPSELTEEFLDRFEGYGRRASTDELRERWARVLAAEVRSPNTFSGRVLRIVDELDSETARSFERVCQFRMADTLPKGLVGELSFDDYAGLVAAELVSPTAKDGVILFEKVPTENGGEVWLANFVGFAIGIEVVDGLPLRKTIKDLVVRHSGSPALPVYFLTQAGAAVASILPNHELEAGGKLRQLLADVYPEREVAIFLVRDGRYQKAIPTPTSPSQN